MERQKLEEAALPLMLEAMWAANVLDIQVTLKKVRLRSHPRTHLHALPRAAPCACGVGVGCVGCSSVMVV
jgi:hypothetical protein